MPKTRHSGVSENIEVVSIVGRLLEHSRIYYFYNNGDERIYLSSADVMTRNMIKRVEILFPVEDKEIGKRLVDFMNLQLSDNQKDVIKISMVSIITFKTIYLH